MLCRRFYASPDFSRMVSNLCNSSIVNSISWETWAFTRKQADSSLKNACFYARVAAMAITVRVGNYSLLESQKNQFFSSGASHYFRSRGFSFHGAMGINLQKNRSLSCMPSICAEVSLADGQSGPRISRNERIDAHKALFEYLHCTRGLSFTDAEHMSKNSPFFLDKLLAKVEDGEHVGRSLSRFLRYHPINEFEPFFESMGLRPTELQPLLPRKLMYLNDDVVLLENYHVFCNYGVPRSKIGRMYKEATEVFLYDYGVLLSKLQDYEKLGLSKTTIIKLVTCCPTLLIGGINLEFHRAHQKLKGLGIELDLIRGCFSDKTMYNWSRIHEMLNFLDRMCCNKKDLSILIKEHPRFVFDDSGKRIYILVAMLLKVGIKMDEILILFVEHPQILVGNFVKNLWRSVHFLLEIGMEQEDIKIIISTSPQVLGSCSFKKPSSVLRKFNMSAEKLCEIIKKDPNQFRDIASRAKISTVSLPKVDGIFLREKTEFLLNIGFIENSDELAKASLKFRGRGDHLQERFDCLVDAGLDCHTVAEMIRSVPFVLNQSADVLKKKIDYLVNQLGYPLEALAAFPTFLCYNMEKIKLRFSMYHWLKEHGIAMPTKNRKMILSTVAPSTILSCSDTRFEKYVVNLHPEGPKVWERLKRIYLQAD